ncbi:unnamed protein product [Closterium sp. NIES-53]
MGVRAGQTCGKFHTEHRCFSHLDDAWHAEFGDDVERPRWTDLLRFGVAIFDLDYDAIISAMYALSFSAKGDCYRCVPPDPGIAAAALGASASGTPPSTAPAEALHTFTLADPSRGPVVARSSTVLPCPAVPSTHCQVFSLRTWVESVHTSYRASSGRCVCSGVRIRSGSRLLLVSPPVAPDSSVAPLPGPPLPAMPSWHALPVSRLWSTQVSASPPVLACPALPSLRRGAAARRSSLLLVSPDNCSPADSPRGLRLQLRERFGTDLPVLHLHSDRGGEFSSDLLRDFCRGEGILQSFTLLDSPQKNGIAERRIRLVMKVARTSMIHATAPHFLWSFGVQYAAHQLNLWPCVSLPETSLTLRWTGKVVDASVFRVWGSRAFVRDTSAVKLSARAIPCIFLRFVPDAPGWQFYHPTLRRVLPSQDVTFDELVPFYRLFPYRSAPPPPPPLFLAPGPPPVDPLPPHGRAPSGVSQIDPLLGIALVQVAVGSGAVSGGAEPGGAEPEGVEPGGAELEGADSGGAAPQGAALSGGPAGASPRLSSQQLHEWLDRRACLWSGATGAGGAGDAGVGGVGVTAGAGGTGGTGAAGFGGACTKGAGAAGTGGVGGAGAGDPTELGAAGAKGSCAGGAGAGGAGAGRAGVEGTGARGAGAAGAGAVDPGADPSFESAAASALVAELLDFATACRLDYPTALAADRTLSVLQLLYLVSLLLASQGDPDAPDIPTPRSYADAITGTYVNEFPPSRANIVDGMWIVRVKRPLGSPFAFKVCYVARGFSQRQGVDYFQTFSPTPKMTTLRVLLHVTAQRD